MFDSNDVNESYSRFLHKCNKVSNNHAPLKEVKLKKKHVIQTVGHRTYKIYED